ncbi:MAG TPA: 4-alpha-glucanotransferase [Bryobacteraceae bacterium]|nr:4-alpha-glucanotransferase [Bryobacteraceae bacterium]
MPFDDAIRAAAERCGVQQQFWDVFGQAHHTDTETNRAILTALGYDCASEEALAASITRREEAERRRSLPAVMVIGPDAPVRLSVEHAELQLEGGEVRHIGAELPANLPLGYHDVRANGCTMRLIVGPDRAQQPAPGKHAGLGVTLYGLRSRRNWGCGDFRDLRDLIDWAVPNLHADFIALNPLHAIHNRTPYNASPYLPNSIFYRNFLYLDVEGVPGFEASDAEVGSEIERLRGTEIVEYEKVAALKRQALDKIFAAHPPGEECEQWIAREGDLLRLYATYCALDEHMRSGNPELWVWTEWPQEYRDPASDAVAEFGRTHEREILFHGWLQWLVDGQLAAVQKHARESGMKIGLYHDLALATDRCGSDLWAHRPFFVNGARVGSPPDGFSPAGQDWSFPPPNEEKHREDGYRLYIETIRKTMRHGGALRIDHVMRLFRLYWIPEGSDATRGAYVKDRPEDLVRILALESVRNNAVIVGEDLGTVETEVRETLARFGILSYRLLIFERNEQGFRPSAEYPEQALTATTTHDLPTIAGFWKGEDIAARLRAGAVDEASSETQKRERIQDKQRLLDALYATKLLPEDYERDASRIPELTPEIHHAVAGFLALTPCALWLVNQEDITREPYQQNLPGTTAEYPNWSRKMRWSIEELSELEEARGSAEMIRHWVERSSRG